MRREKWEILTKKPFRWQDIVLLCAFVCMLILPYVFFSREPGATVEIFCENRHIASYPLHEDRDVPFENNGIRNLIRIRDGSVYVAEADCPDKLCARMRAISKENESIVCVPSGLKVEVRGMKNDLDGVTSREEVRP